MYAFMYELAFSRDREDEIAKVTLCPTQIQEYAPDE